MSAFAVLLQERLRERRLVPLTWGGALGAMSALMVLIWPSLEDTVRELVNSYPKAVMQAFGVTGFNTVEQYVDGELFGLLVPLAAVVLVVSSVIRPIVGAEDAGQLDTWLTMPLPRRALAWSSFAAAVAVLAGALAVMWILTILAGLIAGVGVDAWIIARGVLNVLPLATFFGGVALVAAGATRGSSRVSGIALGTLIAMYVLDIAGKLAPDWEEVRYLSAFRLYGSAISSGLDAGHVVGLTGAGLLLALIGTELFQRRDV